MNNYMKNGNYQKPYFPFEFNPSQFEDNESLDKFYQAKFKEFSKKEYFIHLNAPTDIRKNVNTGCLIGRNITSGLEHLLRIFGVSKSKQVNQGRQVKLKNFRFLDGQIKNTNIMIRVVREQKEDELTSRYFEYDAFNIVHFFYKKKENFNNYKREPERVLFEGIPSKISPTSSYKSSYEQEGLVNKPKMQVPLNSEEIKQEPSNYRFQSTNENNNINNKYEQGDNQFFHDDYSSNNNDLTNINKIINNNKHTNNYKNQSNTIDWNSKMNLRNDNEHLMSFQQEYQQQYQSKSNKEEMINKMYREMKQEYNESTPEQKQMRTEGKANYFYNISQNQQRKIKQQQEELLEMKITNLKLELQLLKSKQQNININNNNLIIID